MKTKLNQLSTLEKMMVIKRLPYWIYWPLLGLFAFGAGELAIRLTNDRPYLSLQILLAIGAGLLPVAYILFAHRFWEAMWEISSVLWEDQTEFTTWLRSRYERIFSIRSRWSVVLTCFIIVTGIITVVSLGLPFSSDALNVFALIGFSWVLFICGHGAYICVDLLFTLHEIVRRPAKMLFFRIEHPAILILQRKVGNGQAR